MNAQTDETNAEFLARVGDPEEYVTAGPWRFQRYNGGSRLLKHDGKPLQFFDHEYNSQFVAKARTDYPEALDRLRAAEAEIARLKAQLRLGASLYERATGIRND